MPPKTKSQLKEFFNAGDVITESAMQDLIDSFQNGPIDLAVSNPRDGSGVEADIYSLGVSLDGTKWIKTGVSDTAWEQIMISENGEFVEATTSQRGLVELATDAETLEGSDTGRVPPVSALASLIAASNPYYRAGMPERTGANELTVSETFVAINGAYHRTTGLVMDLDSSADWDTTTPNNYTVAANRAGKDFYLYACEPTSGTDPALLLSANASAPSGYTTADSVKIGGFHCLCVAVGTISGHALSGLAAGDILPQSVWDLDHRSSGTQEGTVYDPQSRLWVDIYLASWSGTEMQSVNGGTIADGGSSPEFHWYNFVELFGEQGKRLPRQDEFIVFTRGANQATNITGTTDPGTTTGHTDTAGRRMISDIGLEDACGAMWQWGLEASQTGRASSWVDEDTSGDATSYDGQNSIDRGGSYAAPHRPVFGGFWNPGSNCGSRCAVWIYSPLLLSSSFGARGVAESYKQ